MQALSRATPITDVTIVPHRSAKPSPSEGVVLSSACATCLLAKVTKIVVSCELGSSGLMGLIYVSTAVAASIDRAVVGMKGQLWSVVIVTHCGDIK
jgi:hypothetical protein